MYVTRTRAWNIAIFVIIWDMKENRKGMEDGDVVTFAPCGQKISANTGQKVTRLLNQHKLSCTPCQLADHNARPRPRKSLIDLRYG